MILFGIAFKEGTHGLCLGFRCESEPSIWVTCTIRHTLGTLHEEICETKKLGTSLWS